MNALDLSRKKFDVKKISEPYSSLIGDIPKNASMTIFGMPGQGKSTFALDFADSLTQYFGNVIYCSPEEGVSVSMQNKLHRLKITNPKLFIEDFTDIPSLQRKIKETHRAGAVFMDSATHVNLSTKEIIDFVDWCEKSDVICVIVLHATKTGDYKGNSQVVHAVDTNIEIAEGTAYTRKNRYADLAEIEVNFENPKERSYPKEKSETKPEPKDEPMKTRKNPVELPFEISFKKLSDLHKPRSYKRLNQFVGTDKHCYVWDRDEAKEAHFIYIPDYKAKKYTLQLLIRNSIDWSYCSDKGFTDCWNKFVAQNGNKKLMIRDQEHAKKVLGMREYRRQEKAQGKGKGKVSSEKKSYPSTPQPASAKKSPSPKGGGDYYYFLRDWKTTMLWNDEPYNTIERAFLEAKKVVGSKKMLGKTLLYISKETKDNKKAANQGGSVDSTNKKLKTIYEKSTPIPALNKPKNHSETVRVYGKAKGMKGFQAMDWNEGQFVGNLMYATLINPGEIEKAKETLSRTASYPENAGTVFQLRTPKGIVVFDTSKDSRGTTRKLSKDKGNTVSTTKTKAPKRATQSAKRTKRTAPKPKPAPKTDARSANLDKAENLMDQLMGIFS